LNRAKAARLPGVSGADQKTTAAPLDAQHGDTIAYPHGPMGTPEAPRAVLSLPDLRLYFQTICVHHYTTGECTCTPLYFALLELRAAYYP
jgi:hypothetical protein